MIVSVAEVARVVESEKLIDITEEFEPFEYMGEEIEFIEPVHLVGKIMNAGEFLYCRAAITTRLKLMCGKCLTMYEFPLEAELDAHFTDEESTFNEDIDLFFFSGDRIDLKEAVISGIVLAVPNLKLCKDDCRGLCQKCGANLNEGPCKCSSSPDGAMIDERMAALKKCFD